MKRWLEQIQSDIICDNFIREKAQHGQTERDLRGIASQIGVCDSEHVYKVVFMKIVIMKNVYKVFIIGTVSGKR